MIVQSPLSVAQSEIGCTSGSTEERLSLGAHGALPLLPVLAPMTHVRGGSWLVLLPPRFLDPARSCFHTHWVDSSSYPSLGRQRQAPKGGHWDRVATGTARPPGQHVHHVAEPLPVCPPPARRDVWRGWAQPAGHSAFCLTVRRGLSPGPQGAPGLSPEQGLVYFDGAWASGSQRRAWARGLPLLQPALS